MRRFLLFFLCLILLCPCAASAAEPGKYVALTFDGGPSEVSIRALLAGLAVRDARATFFLCGKQLEQNPELAEKILEKGHEIGIQSYWGNDFSSLSRRDIAAEVADTRALLPERCPVRLLRPPGGRCSDGTNQVAKALGLSIADWALEPGASALRDNSAVARGILEQVQDGDVIRIRDLSDSSVSAALNLVDLLQSRGFTVVTVSQLAQIRAIPLRPGQHYSRFPPQS